MRRWLHLSSRLGRRSKLLWTLGGLVALLGLYAALGFWVAPNVLRRQATDFVRAEYGRTLAIGEVRVHPFKLYVELEDVALPDVGGERLIDFELLRVDFEALSSLRHWAYVFHEITLVKPELRAVVRPDGKLNLRDLVGAQAPDTKPDRAKSDEQDTVPDVWIQNLTVAAGGISFIDRARPREFRQRIAPLSLLLRDFRTSAQAGRFALTASSEDGSVLRSRGEVGLVPAPAVSGSLRLSGLALPKLAEYLEPTLPLEIPRGTLALRAAYRAELAKQLRAEATLSDLSLNELALQARHAHEAWVRVQQVGVRDAHIVLDQRRVEVDRLHVQGLTVDARLEPGGELNLARLFSAPRGRKEPPSGGSPAHAPPDREPNQPAWSFHLCTVQLTQGTLRVEDRAIAPGTKLTVSPIRLEATNLSHDLGKPVPVGLEAAFDQGRSRLRLTGTVAPAPLTADLKLDLERARLALAQPYIEQHANLTVHDGALRVQGKLAVRPKAGPEPQLQFVGDASLDDLRTSDSVLRQDFVNAARVEISGLHYAFSPDSLSIERVHLEEPYARVILSANQVLNVSSVFRKNARKTPASKRSGEQAHAQPEEPARREVEAQAKMPTRIDTVRVDGMRLHFSDYFIRPNFSAEIQGLHGTLSGLSSEPESQAKISLRGELGENSPVSITGKTNLFAYDQFTDLTLRSSNIELAVFNPYSGRFAGYNIERGELTTYIRYVVRQRKLSAEHKLRIDQLVWGDATGSKQAAPLPIRLATVLLRDRNGVISLDVPVKGSLDDPGFRVAPFVWQAIKNTFAKVVTAPFEMLGSLFQGAEKARYIRFAPGEATLDASAKQGLDALTQAMLERPELRLLVPVAADPELDRSALVDRKYRALREATMQSTLRRREKKNVKTFDDLDDNRKSKVLSDVYEQVAGKEAKVNAPPLPKQLSRSERRAHKDAYEVAYLEQEVRKSIRVEQSELDALGRQRAHAIERELIAGGKLDSARILLSQEAKVTTDKGKVRLELGLEY